MEDLTEMWPSVTFMLAGQVQIWNFKKVAGSSPALPSFKYFSASPPQSAFPVIQHKKKIEKANSRLFDRCLRLANTNRELLKSALCIYNHQLAEPTEFCSKSYSMIHCATKFADRLGKDLVSPSHRKPFCWHLSDEQKATSLVAFLLRGKFCCCLASIWGFLMFGYRCILFLLSYLFIFSAFCVVSGCRRNRQMSVPWTIRHRMAKVFCLLFFVHLSVFFFFSAFFLSYKIEWGLYTLRHGIRNSMEAILACQPAPSTQWLAWVANSCELWRIHTGPIMSAV